MSKKEAFRHPIRTLKGRYGKELVEFPAQSIRVMTYNICGGTGSVDDNHFQDRPLDEVKSRLEQIAQMISAYEVDIVGMQEVHFGCKVTHYLDQSEFFLDLLPEFHLAENRNFRHERTIKLYTEEYLDNLETPKERSAWSKMLQWANENTALRWDKDYDLGNVIMSRFPIKEHKRTPYMDRWPITSFFKKLVGTDLHTALQEVKLDVGGAIPLYVFNTHLEPQDARVREKSTEIIEGRMHDLPVRSHAIVMGDLNSIPSNATIQNYKVKEIARRMQYGDADNYTGDNCLETFVQSEKLRFHDGFTYERLEDQQAFLLEQSTYHSREADADLGRVIDYILISPKLSFGDSYGPVYSTLSDHRPVIADVVIPADMAVRSKRGKLTT